MNEFNNNNLNDEEKVIADEVADEILTVDEAEGRCLFFLILLFLICLIFLVSSLSFAIFNTYYNGGFSNVIDVGTDVVVNPDKNKKNTTDRGTDVVANSDKNKKNTTDRGTDVAASSDKNKKNTKDGGTSIASPDKNKENTIDGGTVLFTYNSSSNTIDMDDVLPIRDEVGKKLSGDKQHFDFNLSTTIDGPTSGNVVYEISLLPKDGNTLSANDVRVYLTEEGKAVSINSNMVNNFSDLPDSTRRSGAKLIYRKTVKRTTVTDYTFRMWYSYNAIVDNVKKQFGCFVVIDAYYEK